MPRDPRPPIPAAPAAPPCPDDPATWPASARAFLARRRQAAPDLQPEGARTQPGKAARPAAQNPQPGGFQTQPGKAALLAERLRAGGPLPFAAFMRAALYDPCHGYYVTRAEALGPQGDFVTAPETHPAFARLVGERLRALHRELGEPRPFQLVETGAGRGTLAAGLLESLAGLEVDYLILEPFALWRREQERALAPFRGRVRWARSLRSRAPRELPAPAVLLANELLDALPVHRVIHQDGELRELWVHAEGDRFVERPGPLSTPALARYFRRLGFLPPPDRPVEVNLAMLAWLRQAARALPGGRLLLFDYGDTAEEIFDAEVGCDTLRAFRDQAIQPDPLAAVGEQDLTADIDFTTLIREAEALGCRVTAFTSQRAFLLAWGWERCRRRWLRERGPDGPGFDGMLALIDPRRLGQMRALELQLPEGAGARP